MTFTLKIGREICPIKKEKKRPGFTGNQRFDNVFISSTYKAVRPLALSSTG